MTEPQATVYEVMAAAISRELRDNEMWFLGMSTGPQTILMLTRLPIVAMSLAQHTHAQLDRTHSLTHLLQHSYNYVV